MGGAHRAQAAHIGLVVGRPVGEEVGQVEELAAGLVDARKRRRQVLTQPTYLGDLHLGRNRATHGTQPLVAAGVDRRGIVNRAVVHP